jgi:thioesterase domain-containing protein/NAD(P)-dependent dehydrogenase (short-subunit alcohol dehydrogenase family)/acyl carrier protein
VKSTYNLVIFLVLEANQLEYYIMKDRHLILFSAKSPIALQRLLGNFASCLNNRIDRTAIEDIEFTTWIGREHFNYRAAIFCETKEELLKQLKKGEFKSSEILKPAAVVLVLSQKESQLSAKLAIQHHRIIKKCNAIFASYQPELSDRIRLQFTTQLCHAKQWLSAGIEPDCIESEGIGLLVAAQLAGILSVRNAIQLLCLLHQRDPMQRATRLVFHKPKISLSTRGINLTDKLLELKYWHTEFNLNPVITPPQYCQKNTYFIELDDSATLFYEGSKKAEGVNQTLVTFWLSGHPVHWHRIADKLSGQRIPLPNYPFAGKRYWNDVTEVKKVARSDQKYTFYIPSWEPVAESFASYNQTLNNQNVLIFEDSLGVNDILGEMLQAHTGKLVRVKFGAEQYVVSEDYYQLSNYHLNDFIWLFEKLLLSQQIPHKIIYLTSFGNAENLSREYVQKIYFDGLIALAKSIVHHKILSQIEILIISNNGFAVNRWDEILPFKSLLMGPCYTIPKEIAHLNCRLIDFDLRRDNPDLTVICNQIIRELSREYTPVNMAFRDNCLYQQVIKPIPYHPSFGSPNFIKKNNVYLITGGLGGIGLTLASLISKQVNAKLILLNRSSFPARESWPTYLKEHPGDDPICQKIIILNDILARGSELSILQCDITKEDETQESINSLIKQYHTIDGVLHCAGLPGGGAILQRSSQQMATVLAPKVEGTSVLYRVLTNLNIKFIILFSSVNSLLGEYGQLDYCSANAFLDAFSNWASQTKPSVISINWDRWHNTGMALLSPSHEDYHNQAAIQPEECLLLIDQALQTYLPQVIIATQRFDKLLTFQSNSSHPELHSSDDEIDSIITPITDLFIEYFNTIKVNDNLHSYDIDSLLVIELSAKLSNYFKLEIPPHYITQSSSVRALATSIYNLMHSDNYYLQQDKLHLIKLKNGDDSLAPLFLFYPAGGSSFCYHDLVSKLTIERSIYAFEATLPTKSRSVEEIASLCLKKMRAVQTSHFLLCGHSFGGVLAYEVSQQVHNSLRHHALIMMFDTPLLTPNNFANENKIISYLVEQLTSHPVDSYALDKMQEEEKLRYFSAILSKQNRVRFQWTKEFLRHLLDVFQANIESMSKYVPSHYLGSEPIIYFKALERDAVNPSNPEREWKKITQGRLQIYELKGNHNTMMFSPHILPAIPIIEKEISRFTQAQLISEV